MSSKDCVELDPRDREILQKIHDTLVEETCSMESFTNNYNETRMSVLFNELNAFHQLVYLALVFVSLAILLFGTSLNISLNINSTKNNVLVNKGDISIVMGSLILTFVLLGVLLWKTITIQKSSTEFLEKNLTNSLINVSSEKNTRISTIETLFARIKTNYSVNHLCPSDQALISMIQSYLDSINNMIREQLNAIKK